MAKHPKRYVMFADEGSHAFGPFTGHFITHSKIDGTRRRDIDGQVWYIGIIADS